MYLHLVYKKIYLDSKKNLSCRTYDKYYVRVKLSSYPSDVSDRSSVMVNVGWPTNVHPQLKEN